MNNRITVSTWAQGAFLVLMLSLGLVHSQGVVYVSPNPQPYYAAIASGEFDTLIDINGDGTSDFILRDNDPSTSLNNVALIPLNGNELVAGSGGYLANMSIADIVGPSSNLSTDKQTISVLAIVDGQSFEGGNFAGQTTGYIGFDLVQNGQNFYGWLQIQNLGLGGLGGDLAIFGNITEWAYQSSPNTPIIIGQVPEPTTWTLLGFGILSFFKLKRKFP